MRHRRRGRKLGRNPKHQRALLRSLASALFLTKFDEEGLYPGGQFMEKRILGVMNNPPRIRGRIITTVPKAKEVRPLIERCITLAKKGIASEEAAAEFATDAERGTDAWRQWRESDQWNKWNQAMAPALIARRRCIQLIGDKLAVSVLFRDVAPSFIDRPGGYTRIVQLAKPRLGDAGARAILEFTGVNDRQVKKSERPSFDNTDSNDSPAEETASEPAEAVAEA